MRKQSVDSRRNDHEEMRTEKDGLPRLHVAGAKLPPGRPAGAGEAGFWIHPSFISGAARGLLKEFEAGNELAFQLAGLPLLELCRLVHAGKEFELRIRELETRIKALEKKAAQK